MSEQERLAFAMCLSSHHALARSSWPCEYHRKRAAGTLKVLRLGCGLVSTPTDSQGEPTAGGSE